MQNSYSSTVSKRAASWIAFSCLAAMVLFCLAIQLNSFQPGSLSALILVAAGAVVCLSGIGACVTASAVGTGHVMTPRDFVCIAFDVSLLPVLLPGYMFLSATVVGVPIGYFMRFWLNEVHAVVIGLECAAFTMILALPFVPFLWPVASRAARAKVSRSQVARRFALSPPWLLIPMLGFAILVAIAQPTVAFASIATFACLAFYVFYHLLYPYLPRFIFPSWPKQISSNSIGQFRNLKSEI
jgi:hypothetical protein